MHNAQPIADEDLPPVMQKPQPTQADEVSRRRPTVHWSFGLGVTSASLTRRATCRLA